MYGRYGRHTHECQWPGVDGRLSGPNVEPTHFRINREEGAPSSHTSHSANHFERIMGLRQFGDIIHPNVLHFSVGSDNKDRTLGHAVVAQDAIFLTKVAVGPKIG